MKAAARTSCGHVMLPAIRQLACTECSSTGFEILSAKLLNQTSSSYEVGVEEIGAAMVGNGDEPRTKIGSDKNRFRKRW